MQQTLPPQNTWNVKIIDVLRRSPGLRGTLFLTSAVVAVEGVLYFHNPSLPHNVARFHLKTAPIVGVLTYMGLSLSSDEAPKIDWTMVRTSLTQLLRGAGIGMGAYLAWVAAATTCGWTTFPDWGWDSVPMTSVLKSVAIFGLGHFAVAWNEEQVFRGYSFDALRQAIGGWGAVAILTPLFALFHGLSLNGLQLLTFIIAGGVFTLMRIESGSIWLGVGYHWAWNFMETGIFGPATDEPSIRPMVVAGSYQWVGKPGHPQPGLLTLAIQCAVGVGLGLLWLARKRRIVEGKQ